MCTFYPSAISDNLSVDMKKQFVANLVVCSNFGYFIPTHFNCRNTYEFSLLQLSARTIASFVTQRFVPSAKI